MYIICINNINNNIYKIHLVALILLNNEFSLHSLDLRPVMYFSALEYFLNTLKIIMVNFTARLIL